MKRVAVLLIRNLSEALRQRSIEAAGSEPYWLRPGQYQEHDGGVAVIPAMASDLIAYATSNHLRLLGLVIVNEDGDYHEYFNQEPLSPADREFALRLFQAHAHFWFCEVPAMTDDQMAN
jgi:hypothetical protein